MSNYKTLICFSWNNKFNIHSLIIKDLINKAPHYGFEVKVIHSTINNFLNFYLNQSPKRMESVLINWGPYISLAVKTLNNLPKSKRDRIYAKSIFILEDHPFADWVSQELAQIPSSCYVFGLRDAQDFIKVINPSINFIPKDFIYRRPELQEKFILKERYIDVLVAMDFRKNTLDLSTASEILNDTFMSDKAYIFYEMYDLYKKNINISAFSALNHVLTPLNTSIKEIAQNDRDLFQKVINIVHIVDMNVRRRRRLDLLKDFLDKYPHLRVLICAHPDELDFDVDFRNVTLIGNVDHRAYHSLLTISKYSLFSNPTYQYHINQRVNDAINFGCAIICDQAPALQELFEADDFGLFTVDSLEDSLSKTEELSLKIVNTHLHLRKYPTLTECFLDTCQGT